MSNDTTIKCPQCETQINVNEVLYAQFKHQFDHEHTAKKADLEQQLSNQNKQLKQASGVLKQKEQAFEAKQAQFDEKLQIATAEKIKTERLRIHATLKAELEDAHSESTALLEKELAEKSSQVKELNASKIMITRLKRENEETELRMKAQAEAEFSITLKQEREKIQTLADQQNELKLKQKDEQLEQIKRQLDETKRKAEQGSMQLQGEAQELAIESWLAAQFPFDSLQEISKGAFGADCIQTVNTRDIQNCGKICYESKNAKAWNATWIEKLKQDMLKAGADIGVLVTQVMPKELDRMGFLEGVWVCDYEDFKGCVSLLRQSLIQVSNVSQLQENRTDKMGLLYEYLSSNEFNMQLTIIVDGFVKMQAELEKEKRSLMASWKRRQKTIDGVLVNTTEMYGSIKGIAGSAVGHIPALSLNEDDAQLELD